MNAKKYSSLFLCALLALTLLAGCISNAGDETAQTPSGANGDQTGGTSISAAPSNSDLATAWAQSDTKIALDGANVTVNGSGAQVEGSIVTITAEGTYVVSGTLTNGQIAVAATNADKVHLVLNGASITNETGAAIYASQCDKLILTLAEGTVNTLKDGGASFRYADEAEEEPNAALFSKDDLTINGTGSLTVTAGFKNGISTKDDLMVVSGNITVTAANHALAGKDSVAVLGGALNLAAGNDGIQTNTTDDLARGWVLLGGGKLTVSAAHDGVQADTTLQASGAAVTIVAGGGTAGKKNSFDDASNSFKGLKSGGSLSVSSGIISIDSADNCLHATGDMLVSGGKLTLSSGENGAHSDAVLTVKGGSIAVLASYEGLEGASIDIYDGQITIASTDDAINAAGGADQSAGGGFSQQGSNSASGSYFINIAGGTVQFIAGGDGVDSNGTITISGGTLYAFIDSTADNGALDSDGSVTVTGGILIYGGTGVGNVPDDDSTQSYVYLESSVAAGTELSVRKDGAALVSATLPINCKYLAVSVAGITANESYDVYGGATLLSTVTAGTGGGREHGGTAPDGGRG
ncbi:MAG TPA: carbohydrate-binding domain-containing protein [Clostridia bacterium]|nr:carbohydrate-binding domain-containing protein [Clostridia bacterium]